MPILSDHSLTDLYSYLLLCINVMAIGFSDILCVHESLLFPFDVFFIAVAAMLVLSKRFQILLCFPLGDIAP